MTLNLAEMSVVKSRLSVPHGANLFGFFYVVVYFVMDARLLCCVHFSFSVLSQEIVWEERPRNDLFCVGWDVKP